MTTINSTIFSNLYGASPSLLNRALELINNSKLNTLETLRQSLSSGELIIRTITSDDNISPRAHASLINPEIDQVTKLIVKPGVILVRSENLVSASDASVLQFVDDIFHEGQGHGARIQVDKRKSAAENLVLNSEGFSDTERGDRFVNSFVDDETISRYKAFTFRQELATLSTEYTASNRAVLQTDETYRAFTRLSAVADEMGLTGDDKKAYVVEMARPVVAAYNDHFYRDTAIHHVLNVLNLNGTEAGTAYVDHVTETLNVVGYTISDVVMHDDGSSSAGVVYENGDRRDLVFDSSGSLSTEQRTTANGDSTTMRYDASGHLMSSTETDGAHDNADYATRTTSYDAQGREDWVSTLNDDGTRDSTDFDQTNVRFDKTWSNHIDAQGREDYSP